MGQYTFDDSSHPVVRVTMEGELTDAQFAAYLADLDRNLRRREYTVVVLDALKAESTPARQRRMQAEWMKTNEGLLRRYTLGTVMMLGSPVMRGVLTAILWIQPIPTPYAVVGSLEEAAEKAEEMLAAKGLPMPRFA